jgi:hypothetical protein
MNNDKKMAELYLERAAGKKHTYMDGNDKSDSDFSSCVAYKLKHETLDEAIKKAAIGQSEYITEVIKEAMKQGAKWAWANPESKE